MVALPEIEIIERRDHEAVLDFSGCDQFRNFRDGDQSRHQVFSMVEVHRMEALAVLNQHGEASIAHDGRVRKNLAD
jgi:hypothetical protein